MQLINNANADMIFSDLIIKEEHILDKDAIFFGVKLGHKDLIEHAFLVVNAHSNNPEIYHRISRSLVTNEMLYQIHVHLKSLSN